MELPRLPGPRTQSQSRPACRRWHGILINHCAISRVVCGDVADVCRLVLLPAEAEAAIEGRCGSAHVVVSKRHIENWMAIYRCTDVSVWLQSRRDMVPRVFHHVEGDGKGIELVRRQSRLIDEAESVVQHQKISWCDSGVGVGKRGRRRKVTDQHKMGGT